MDFDQMLETWRAQNTAPPYNVNRDALRQAFQTEEARILLLRRNRRRVFWPILIFGAGMAVWAGFWIAITITNGWPAIYAVTAGVSSAMFTLGVGAVWKIRRPLTEPERNFGNPLQEEVRRCLALVDYQLSVVSRWILIMLGAASIVAGTGLFIWTVTSSPDILHSSGSGWIGFTVVFVFFVRVFQKGRNAIRKEKATMELRQRHLRELLTALGAGEEFR